VDHRQCSSTVQKLDAEDKRQSVEIENKDTLVVVVVLMVVLVVVMVVVVVRGKARTESSCGLLLLHVGL
jgi:heme/copper-type cytochrome/quinol oxidase subunit 2